ncbi:hypothetical protein ACEYYA_02580 [Paracoccus sp. p3-h83]|uniref:hypothetical protein n=1 Tax=Paracoccus sp. p3-h83 TaxID=3342805 RepID=UPI0035BA1822
MVDIATSITGSISIPLVGHRLGNEQDAVRTILTMVAHSARDHGCAPSDFLRTLEKEGTAIAAQVWGEGNSSALEAAKKDT